ncbi:MAG: hypothetical protein ACNI28_01785 [Arcobacter sp.]|uniref:hypothetical protein n=1 Tax=Arcobacter sp. TaxID=1872629 RepID=UPI003B004513
MNKLLHVCFIIGLSITLIGCSISDFSIGEKKSEPKKEIIRDKNCNKYKKAMDYASIYIQEEFEKGYFSKKDIVGAKAQLFLIESGSPTIFAKNINAAKDSYDSNYNLSKKGNCNLKSFYVHPLVKLKNSIETLEKQKAK